MKVHCSGPQVLNVLYGWTFMAFVIALVHSAVVRRNYPSVRLSLIDTHDDIIIKHYPHAVISTPPFYHFDFFHSFS